MRPGCEIPRTLRFCERGGWVRVERPLDGAGQRPFSMRKQNGGSSGTAPLGQGRTRKPLGAAILDIG